MFYKQSDCVLGEYLEYYAKLTSFLGCRMLIRNFVSAFSHGLNGPIHSGKHNALCRQYGPHIELLSPGSD